MLDYDVIILGGGLAYVGAEVLKNAGLKVAIVRREASHLEGVCLHERCILTKLYLFSYLLEGLKEKKQRLTKSLKASQGRRFHIIIESLIHLNLMETIFWTRKGFPQI